MAHEQSYELKGLLETSVHFNSTESFAKYVNDQLENFLVIQSEPFEKKSSVINTIVNELSNLKNALDIVVREFELRQVVSNVQKNNVQKFINSIEKNWVPYGHPVLEKQKELFYSLGVNGELAFWKFISGQYQQPGNVQQMSGILAAYEFINQKINLAGILDKDRSFVEEHYSKAIERGNELEEMRQTLDKRISDWEDHSHQSWTDWEKSCSESWESLTENKNEEWYTEKSQFNAEHNELLKNASQKLIELEATYQEHLKLEKPAQYWERSAKKYENSSALWGGILTLLILVGIAGFVHFYTSYLQGQELEVKLDTVKGIILFFSGITVYGFLIRVVSRLLMSATHLQRDSEERAQLTYFYLSLIKDGAIDESSRDIVIQSLFSRTETGLLAGDSSPTMPAVDLVKNIKLNG
ncbi:hypothetical protein R1U54_000106 [Vibrio fluvialis]|nr:hypothetical protein [Vibrio fluvialis]